MGYGGPEMYGIMCILLWAMADQIWAMAYQKCITLSIWLWAMADHKCMELYIWLWAMADQKCMVLHVYGYGLWLNRNAWLHCKEYI